jgi:hypothetical protein
MMPGRIKRIWSGLVDYANANLETDTEALLGFADCFEECIPWTARKREWEENQGITRSFKTKHRPIQNSKGFLADAANFQPDIRNLLAWLCNPKPSPDDTAHAVQFLRTHINHIQRNIFDDPRLEAAQIGLEPWKVGSKSCRMWWAHRTSTYQCMIDPICDFILKEHERFHDEEFETVRKDKSSLMVPIRICARPGCGKFIMPERTDRKKYCSDVCRASKDREERPDFKRCYQCLFRLENDLSAKKFAVIRKKLQTSTTQHNLQELETRWPKYAERVRKIRARANS